MRFPNVAWALWCVPGGRSRRPAACSVLPLVTHVHRPIRPRYLPFGQPNFSAAEIAAVTRVVRSGWVGMGPETLAFERELAAYLGAPHVVTVNSCTSALFLALLAHGVGPGDEVIVPSLTWCSTANAALYLGARPVFCDVDARTLSLTPESIERQLTRKTRAVMVVHLGGLAVDVEALARALPRRVAIVEDAAHALGARFADGRRVGASGHLTCFSFYANKNLSTGEGGAIALGDEALAARLRSLRQHGLHVDAWKRFTHPRSLIMSPLTTLGYKMNYTDLQAAIGRVQLARQEAFHARRLAIARLYDRALGELVPAASAQAGVLDDAHARHLFVVRWPGRAAGVSRDALLVALRGRNIGATIHYTPLHRMPLYRHLTRGTLPVTDRVCRQIVTLPIGARMTLRDARDVVSALESIVARARIGRRRAGARSVRAA